MALSNEARLKGGGIVGVSRLFLLVILLPGEGLCFEGESMLDEDLTESPAEGGGNPAAYTRLAGVKTLEQQDSLQSSSSLAAVRRALEMLSRIEAIDRESLHEVRRGIGSVQQELTLLRYERENGNRINSASSKLERASSLLADAHLLVT
ncbi:hypothetical protein FOL46_001987 [Perkinsus olseni]|uniref:Uncharacterized protein n=1 Tax=Perkinsus olseni TaxID=32597 RepID=A0A7J6MUS3_PEROL|nr:hypothetical protein FOL46_001987 [Perkinsus olseni]